MTLATRPLPAELAHEAHGGLGHDFVDDLAVGHAKDAHARLLVALPVAGRPKRSALRHLVGGLRLAWVDTTDDPYAH